MVLPEAERLKRGRAAVINCSNAECDKCLHVCGFLAIKRGEDGMPYSDPDKCVGCGGCCAICPEGAIMLLKDRGGSFEFTVPFNGELPEIDDMIELTPPGESAAIKARVIQAIPKRPNATSALVRASAEWSVK